VRGVGIRLAAPETAAPESGGDAHDRTAGDPDVA
jgi:hypothetical protein